MTGANANSDLGQAIYSHTKGNLSFTIQLLQSLSEENLLVKRKDGWDMQRIEEAHIPEDATDFIKTKLLRFDREMQELLMIVSCLGAEVEESVIYHLVEQQSAKSRIAIAVSKGLVTTDRGNVYFAHDCIQLASLALIPTDEKESFHLSLGRQLHASMTPEELESNMFLVTNQLCLGSQMILGLDERYVVSALCLRAGIRATKSSAFVTASTYFELGIQLLGVRHWRDEYRLSLDLYRATAEVASSKGEFEQVDQLLNGIFENARCFHDKIPAYTIQVYALGSRSEYHQAIDVGLEVLAQLGEAFPKRARTIHIILAFLKTKKMLRDKSDSDILNMPPMEDENKLAAMRLLNIIGFYAFNCRPTLNPLIALRTVQVSITYGMCDVVAASLSSYGALLCAFGDIEAGIRYGELSCQLLYRLDAKEWLGRVFSTKYGMIDPWQSPLRNSLAPLMRAHRSGLATGDVEVSICQFSTVVAIMF
jgi:predicted ATPase